MSTQELSDYEALRAKNIERNNARLRALGLISAKEETTSNVVAWRKVSSTSTVDKENTKNDTAKRKRKAGGNADSSVRTIGSRKSLRLQGEGPDMESQDVLPDEETEPQSASEEREARVKECREIRLRRALEVSEAGADKAAMENPTATYDHCLMRVRTMTDKGLANRVKAIERAAGKHCVVKMAIFKSCLQDQGLWDLAELAACALERLKALKPPVEEE
jgi:hypothetical protein